VGFVVLVGGREAQYGDYVIVNMVAEQEDTIYVIVVAVVKGV
jgi:hypothetical protein